MREPVLILSDLHLGHGASKIASAEQLRPLLQGAATVVFNGDTFQELATSLRPASEVLLAELKSLCAELGVDAVFLSGNHDPGWAGKGWVEFAEGGVVVTHGDAVMWEGSPWSREAFVLVERLRELWAEHRAAGEDAGERLKLAREIALLLKPPRVPKGRSLLRRAMDAVNPPRRALEILRVWAFQAEAVAKFGRTYFPKAQVLVVGHFHRKGAWRRDGRLVINTGAYVNPHRAMWVCWDGGFLRWGEVGEVEGSFERGECLGVVRVSS